MRTRGGVRRVGGLFGLWLLLGVAACGTGEPGEAGLLADLLGERLKEGLGLISGQFVEFSWNRVRMVDVKMVAPDVDPTARADANVFLRVQEVAVDFSPMEVLLRNRVDRVVLDGPEIWLGEIAAGGASIEGEGGAGQQLTIGELVISDITLHVDNLADTGPSVLLRFATDDPLVLHDVRLGDLADNPQADVEQVVRSRDVLLSSGFGPMAPLGTVELIVVRFTWSGIAAGRLAALELIHPVLFVGQDWFDLLQDLQAAAPTPPGADEPTGEPVAAARAAAAEGDAALALERLTIEGLRLALTSFGIVDVMLPFTFDYSAESVVLDAAGNFLLESTLSVRRTDWELPAQNLYVEGLKGELAFNLPPESESDNVVPTFTAERLSWAGIRTSEPWVSITIMPATPASAAEAKAQTGDAALDVQFGAQLTGSYLQGWIGATMAFDWQATLNVWRTGAGPAEPFARLGLSEVTGLYAKATGSSTTVTDGQVTLVTAESAEVVLELGGDITAFLQENFGVQPSAEDRARAEVAAVATAQRLRWGQIQALKNQRLVGENADGLLVARVPNVDAEYPGASELIAAENADRRRIYEFVAQHDDRPVADVEREYAERWRLLAFPGEWVQTPEGRWYQK